MGLISGLDGQILTLSGGSAVWVNPGTVSVPVDTVFGRTGDILGMTGDYISDQVTEGLTNLYFTDLRAQNALSGSINSLSGSVNILSGRVLTAESALLLLSGSFNTLSTNFFSLSGTVINLS